MQGKSNKKQSLKQKNYFPNIDIMPIAAKVYGMSVGTTISMEKSVYSAQC
ncbi:hypothetical protein PaeBR_08385 [Paenibacillus sp. BR2-3]